MCGLAVRGPLVKAEACRRSSINCCNCIKHCKSLSSSWKTEQGCELSIPAASSSAPGSGGGVGTLGKPLLFRPNAPWATRRTGWL
jgi:hypothetical protein